MLFHIMRPLTLCICMGSATALPAQQARPAANPSKAQSRNVVINRVRLADQDVFALERKYVIRIRDGAYWYDKMSGAWGIEGGPTLGIGAAGLNVGGPLRVDASNGSTGVFINGRELHQVDVLGLLQLGPVLPGRYWVDALGNCGYEGGPPLVNLVQLAQARARQGGGAWSHSSGRSWIGGDGNGGLFATFTDGTGKPYEWSK